MVQGLEACDLILQINLCIGQKLRTVTHYISSQSCNFYWSEHGFILAAEGTQFPGKIIHHNDAIVSYLAQPSQPWKLFADPQQPVASCLPLSILWSTKLHHSVL